MKTAFTLIVSILLSMSMYAQRPVYAPDFGLTGEYGDTMFLYEDLLDNNKTVVLAFFGVGCVSCENAVPTLDSLYTHYGENQDDFYLWAIEPSQVYDYDAVNTWLSEQEASYPGWATTQTDSVVELYGAYFTPQYFVICPDGSMRDYSLEHIPGAIENCLGMVSVADVEEEVPDVYLAGRTLVVKNTGMESSQLEIFAITGKSVSGRTLSGDTRFALNLPEGLYIYRLTDSRGRQHTGRFMMP
ncbi:MAG: redoxin domain-containing protein [Bacteroidales bacterium]